MFKKVKQEAVNIQDGTSIKAVFDDMVTSDLQNKASVVLSDFVRKDTERQTAIAKLKNDIKEVEKTILTFEDEVKKEESKLEKAEKVSNQAGIARTIAILKADIAKFKADIDVLNAKIVNLETLRSAAATKRDSFIVAFDENPFDALANTDLVREGLNIEVVKFNKDTLNIINAE